MRCNNDSDCTLRFGDDVRTKCSTLDYEDEGACVPLICEDNSDCPEVGHPCRGGAIPEGMCNMKTYECQYPSHYYMAKCVPNSY